MKVIIDGVEYVPKKETIEDIHKKNLAFISRHDIKVGDMIATFRKDRKHFLIVTHIHPDYGWIEAEDGRGWKAYNIPIENIVDVWTR
jgi:hypothetical protein